MVKFRKGIDKEKIIKSLDDKDWEYLNERKQYLDLKPDTYRAKCILQSDDLRRGRDKAMLQVEEQILVIKNTLNNIKRLKIQLNSGDIKERDKFGTIMSEDEVKLMIEQQKKVAWSISMDLHIPLKQLQSYIDYKDISGKVVYTEDEFNEYVSKVESTLKDLGYKLFDNNVAK